MMQRIARRAHTSVRAVLAPALVAQRCSALAAASACAAPHAALAARSFAAAAAPAAAAPAKAAPKGKAAVADAAAAAAAEKESNALSAEDEYNMIPPIAKPSAADLEALCLTEEQMRFAKRAMPDAAARRKMLPSVYVPEGRSILEHSSTDVGSYFEVPESMQRAVPIQIHRAMAVEFMGGGGYMMVREPALSLKNEMQKVHAGESIKQRVYGLRGASGCGKSATLHYISQYIRAQNERTPEKPWLLIATRGQEFPLEKRGFIAPSTVKPGIYDQALYTMDYFARMAQTEAEALKLITLKRKDKLADVVWGPEGTPRGTTLYDLVLLASTDRAQAPRLLYDFVAELRLDTEVPVCVMIDNLNVWGQVSEFIEPHTYKPLDPKKLALVDAFDYFTREAPKNGTSIWSLTTRYSSVKHAYPLFSPRSVRGVDAYHYSVQELKHCIVHYSVSEFILSEINQELIVRIAGLTGRVPRDVHQQAFFR